VKALGFGLAFLALLGLAACGDDDGGDDTGSGGTSSEGGAPGGASLCRRGCADTLAANCANGPASQSECEADCQALERGSCGSEYQAFQVCAEGETVTCSASGLPTVPACTAEQQAFVACLSP
jgi:hypothetical protein